MPTPLPIPKKTMDFGDAMRAVIQGHRVTKLEWNNSQVYLTLISGFLCMVNDGKENRLLVSDGDMAGQDWIIADVMN